MFVYENGNSLNLTFKGNIPVTNPEVVIKGYKNGATLTVNGTVYGNGNEEFEGKAETLVYQKDDKLMITFLGITGMTDPEVVIDDLGEDMYEVALRSTIVTLHIVNDGVEVVTNNPAPAAEVEEPVAVSEPEVVEEEEPVVETTEEE